MVKLARLLALIAIVIAAPVLAQTTQDGFVVPPDVQPYETVTPVYASGTTASVVGDGSNDRGGTMPVLAEQPDDIPTILIDDWTGAASSAVEITNPSAQETKSRFTADFSHMNKDDPLRNYGDPGAAHWHCYFGNTTTNAFSTYQSFRNRANEFSTGTPAKSASSAGGGPVNATGYWVPCVTLEDPFGDGKNYALPFYHVVIYYKSNPASKALYTSRLPRGLGYITGTNMDDPYDTQVKAEIAAANAQPGTSGRYAYSSNGFGGWSCSDRDGTNVVPVVNEPLDNGLSQGFKTSTGDDPWDGACTTGKALVAHVSAPDCYDGRNLWSPGGYKHFRHRVTDNARTDAWEGCPDGWWQVPKLDLTVWYAHEGWADYSRWKLSSDDMANMAALAIDPEAEPIVDGGSFHTDWKNGWDDSTLMLWLDTAFGVDGNTTLYALDANSVGTDLGLAYGATPDGTRDGMQVNLEDTDDFVTSDVNSLIEIPDSVGPVTVPIHGH